MTFGEVNDLFFQAWKPCLDIEGHLIEDKGMMVKANQFRILLPEGVEWAHLEDPFGADNTKGWDVLRCKGMGIWDYFNQHFGRQVYQSRMVGIRRKGLECPRTTLQVPAHSRKRGRTEMD